jgi:hypothetical protein
MVDAESRWIDITVETNHSVTIEEFFLKHGIFCDCVDKSKQIEPEIISIPDGGSAKVCSRGRSGTALGTEGSIDIFDTSKGKPHIGKFEWNCPYKGKNSYNWTPGASGYDVRVTGGNITELKGDLDKPEIGNVNIKITKY